MNTIVVGQRMLEVGDIHFRPNRLVAVRPKQTYSLDTETSAEILIDGFPHWITVNLTVDEVLEHLRGLE